MYVDENKVKRYKIMSRDRAQKYCLQNHSRTSVIISIRSSWDKVLPSLPMNDKNNVKDVLFLAFDDVDKEDSPECCIQPSDAKKVAEFVEKYYDKVDDLIFHCDGGISRSAGVTAAVMRAKEGNDYYVFKINTKCPNMTCYLETLKAFKYI